MGRIGTRVPVVIQQFSVLSAPWRSPAPALMADPCKPRDLVTFDLHGSKQAWLAWCARQGLRPSEAFRQIVAKLTASPNRAGSPEPARVVKGDAEKPLPRKIWLTASEYAKAKELAAQEGFAVSKWIAALVRARITHQAQCGQQELEALGRSNQQLLVLNRNLNLLANALAADPAQRSALDPDLLRALDVMIRAHTECAADVMAANLQRWKIE